ncbi:hypothetical protein [Cupriavidus basilensis]|uniref:hypothetical protein n=1 Tax=Cupriavidus basilensis TaxID=68895 RepID=UPI00157B53D2|nr:hypothetical protein [Cupriavidus basilensis]NUA25397.1 hypothetical protein [Cupriavidus basilensis]
MNTLREPRFQQWVQAAAIVGIFSIYYLYYFTNFKDGDVDDVPAFIAIAKLCAFSLFTLCLLPFRVSDRYQDDLLLVPVLALCGISYGLAVAAGYDQPTALFLNALIFLPVLFSARVSEQGILSALMLIKNIILVQCLVGFVLRYLGIDLWTGGAVSGGVGNPSSFGLLCCISYLYVDTFARRWPAEIAEKLVLALGAVATNSVFSLMTMACIVLLVEIKNKRLGFLLMCFVPALAAAGFFVLQAEAEGKPSFLIHKILAVLNFVGLVDYDVTAGITGGRIADHLNLLAGYVEEPASMLWGHMGSTVYRAADSQYVSYLASFGIPLTLLFVLVNLKIYASSKSQRTPEAVFLRGCLLIFLFNFFVNRILDYFPMTFIYLIVVIGLSRGAASVSTSTKHVQS